MINHSIIGHKKIIIAYISGHSMAPLIKNGDRVYVIETKKYDLGDIILFENNNKLICHRIIKIKDDYYFCKGDNWNNIDIINKKEIHGKVFMISSLGKKIELSQLEINKEKISKYSLMLYKLSLIEKLDMNKIRNTEIYKKMIDLIKV